MKNKHINLIIIIYCSVLLIGTVFYYIIPKGSIAKANSDNGYQSSMYYGQEAKKAIEGLKNKKILDRYKVESFRIDKDTLEISADDKRVEIILERKSTNDNRIEVYSLSEPTLVWRSRAQNILTSPNIALYGSNLTVNWNKSKFEYVRFSKNNTITQFFINGNEKDTSVFNRNKFGEDNMDTFNYMDFSQFEQSPKSIIYIQIPKDLKVDGKYENMN